MLLKASGLWETLFLPPSDVCVRSCLCLFYTLINLYHTKALSDQASSLAAKYPSIFHDSATTFHSQGAIFSTPHAVHSVPCAVSRAV